MSVSLYFLTQAIALQLHKANYFFAGVVYALPVVNDISKTSACVADL